MAAVTPSRPPTLIEALEWLFCLLSLAMMSEALIGPIFAPDETVAGPEWLRLVWMPIYAGLAGLLVLRAPRLPRVWLGAALSLMLVAFAFLSTRWSIAPDITSRRALALLFTTLFGLYIAARYGWRALVELLAATFFVLAVGSVIAALLFPDFGVHRDIHPGAWKGLWYQKNQMGAIMAKGALACLCAAVMVPQRRLFWSGGVALCSVLVIATTSTTSLLALLIVFAGAAFLAMVRRGGPLAVLAVWGAVVGVGALVGLYFVAPDLLFDLVGKDATLTGRTDIWASLLRRVQERPWQGYGYAAFWQDPMGPAWYIRNEIEWEAPTAHNGWLDLLVQLGWIGLGLFAVHLLINTGAALRWSMAPGVGLWAMLSTALFLLFSLSESTILQQNNLNWVIYVATAAKLLEWRYQLAPPPRQRTAPTDAAGGGSVAPPSAQPAWAPGLQPAARASVRATSARP